MITKFDHLHKLPRFNIQDKGLRFKVVKLLEAQRYAEAEQEFATLFEHGIWQPLLDFYVWKETVIKKVLENDDHTNKTWYCDRLFSEEHLQRIHQLMFMGPNQKLKDLTSRWKNEESLETAKTVRFDGKALWSLMETKALYTATKLHLYIVSCILAGQISCTGPAEKYGQRIDKRPANHLAKSTVVYYSSRSRNSNSTRKADWNCEKEKGEASSSYSDEIQKIDYKNGNSSEVGKSLTFGISNEVAFQWAKQRDLVTVMQRKFGVHVRLNTLDSSFEFVGTQTEIVESVIDFWGYIFEKFRSSMISNGVRCSVKLTDEILVKFVVDYETLLFKDGEYIQLYAFNRRNIENAMEELGVSQNGREVDKKANNNTNCKPSLPSVSKNFIDDYSLNFDIVDKDSMSWLIGSRGAHFKEIKEEFDVKLVIKNEINVVVTGERKSVEECTIAIFKRLAMEYMKMKTRKIENLKNRGSDIDVLYYITAFSVYIDVNKEVAYGFTDESIEEAFKHIQSNTSKGVDITPIQLKNIDYSKNSFDDWQISNEKIQW